MLSRLKGIETSQRSESPVRCTSVFVQICFPVWRELKLLCVFCCWFALWVCSDMLSRLKGIETLALIVLCPCHNQMFRYAFPFEGNWNFFVVFRRFLFMKVQICFPVWRELKLLIVNVRESECHQFRYAFPFEGNWNPTTTVFPPFFPIRSDMLSRLKGIETIRKQVPMQPHSKLVQICFPVWRELKHGVSKHLFQNL